MASQHKTHLMYCGLEMWSSIDGNGGGRDSEKLQVRIAREKRIESQARKSKEGEKGVVSRRGKMSKGTKRVEVMEKDGYLIWLRLCRKKCKF